MIRFFFPVVVVNFGRISFASGVTTIRKYLRTNFLFCFFSKFFYDGLDLNLIVFKTFAHSSLIFFSAFFAKLMIFERLEWNSRFHYSEFFLLCLFVENVVYFVLWTNAKWKIQKKLQLWIDKFILEIDEKPIILKKIIINILVSFKNNEQPYLCKLIQVLLLQYLITFMAQLNSLYCVYNRLHCCCLK